jgi:cytochrome P450
MSTATTPDAAVATGIALTTLDARFREDPYPILADLREREPVHHDMELGRWVMTRHADVHAVLFDLALPSDPRKGNEGTFSRRFLAGMGDEEPSMLLMDDPDHKRLRGLVRRSFTPRAVEAWRGKVRAVAERIIAAAPDEPFDLMEAVADPLPTVVIAEMLGLDPERHADFKEWSSISVAVGFNPMPTPEQTAAGNAARKCLDDFFAEEIDRRRGALGDDLISDMLRAEEAGDRLTPDEIIRQCDLLLIAGNVTTTDLIGNTVKALIDFPDEAALLRARPELLPNAIEEALRYDSPVTNSGRIANEGFEIGGVPIAKGESLSVSLAAANRDPRVHPDPDRFDIQRKAIQHLSFGGGRHFCLGAHLARTEAQEAVRALLARFGTLTLADAGYRYAATPSFRGFEELWIATAPG